jgi:hypothetical protein
MDRPCGRTSGEYRFRLRFRFKMNFRLLMEMEFHGLFIETFRFPLDDGDSILGTVSEAGAQTVTELITDQFCLSVNDLESSLRAIRNAEPTAITFVFVNSNNLSCCHFFLLIY